MKIMKIVKIEADQTHNTSFADLTSSSDPSEDLSSLRWEISRLQTLEQGLVKFSRGSSTVQNDVETQQARRDTRIRKCLAIVVGLGLLVGFVLAIVKVMKDKNVRFIGESGGNAPVTFQELQLHNTEQDCWVVLYDDVYDLTSYAKNHPGGSFLITDLAGTDGTGSFDAFHPAQLLKTVQRYRIGQLVVEDVSVPDREESEGAPLDDESDSEAQGTPPPENENAAPPADSEGQGTPPPPEDENAAPPAEEGSQAVAIRWEELALHSTPADCWIALHGHVYDLTVYAPSHPGGPGMITQLAGTDGTVWFDMFHEPILLQTMQTFKVGPLAAPLVRN
jgi:cytochrome b involved in lipid metabolism